MSGIDGLVFTHYYNWWGPSSAHWDGGNPSRPGLPDNVATSEYPLLGMYDCTDPAVLDLHCQWMKLAGTDVIVLSWWGQASTEEARLGALLDAALPYGLKVCVTLEPYTQGATKRTPAQAVSDLSYLMSTYKNHRAFFRVSRRTKWGPSVEARPVAMVFQALHDATDPAWPNVPNDPAQYAVWAAALDPTRGGQSDTLWLLNTDAAKMFSDSDIRGEIDAAHCDGLYTYDVTDYGGAPGFAFPRHSDYAVVYAVGPGFDDTRIRTPGTQISRNKGTLYDRAWLVLHSASIRPEAVAITTFNEHHEGTGIEPCQPKTESTTPYTYLDFEGHHALSGSDAYGAYLLRSAAHVHAFKHSRNPTGQSSG